MRNASVSAPTIVAMVVAAAVWIDREPHAAAQPGCDELNPNCVLDPGDTSFDPSEHTTSNVPQGDYDGRSGPADLGLGTARSRRSTIALTPEACGGAAAGAAIAAQSIVQQYAAILTQPAVCDGIAPLEALLHAVPGPVPVPNPTGVPQTIGPAAESAPGDDSTTDPVDPVTGEFVHAQVDLELPSWGVPFRLRRVYRSRIDFDGALGPGWDHVYDQRLASAPRVAIGEDDPLPTGTLQLGDADITVPVVSVSACGPSLVLSTGEGTAVRFNEIAISGGVHSYWSTAALLTLTGTDGPDGTTWTLRAPDGSTRHFDAMGRLVRWVDANEIGLTLTWSGDATYARLESVIDSVGREIAFEYDAERLVRVVDRSSGLEVRYTYDAHGALWTARSADGSGERYEYDYDAARGDGAWVPEGQLRAGCEAACARTDMNTCDTGGACDVPVATAFQACNQWVEDDCPGLCHLACVDQCTGGPGAFYDSLPCDAQCEHDPAQYGLLVNECVRVWNEEGAKEICQACDDTCSVAATDTCTDLAQTGGFVPGNGEPYDWVVWNSACHDSLTSCCADGSGCAAGSCNAGDQCEQICEQAFFGTDEIDTGCRKPCNGQDPDEPPACPIGTPRFACIRDATDECKRQCGIGCAAEQCEPTCAAECTQSSCLAMDFEATCNDTCTESCIAAGRGDGQIGGTLFGHAADLNFNLVRIRDGAERLYLENTYGTDLRSPDFDAVVSQQFGEYNPWLARWDLVASAAGAVQTPLPAWADPLIDEAGDFEPVEICPFTCTVPPTTAWNEAIVPFATDLYLVFTPGAVTSPTTGFTVAKQLGQSVGPTLVTFSTNAQGAVVGTISRRTSTTSYFATTATTLPITLDGGATVTLATSRTGAVTITGTAGGKDQLLRMGSMTLFTDAARRVQAYAGAPIEILRATSGQCSAPFTCQQVSSTEIQLVPATACTGELWLTPVGGRYPDQAAADQFPTSGLAALSTSAFHASTLAPTRGGAIWRQGIDGRRVREAPPTGTGVTDAGKAALAQYTATPMFSAPTATSGRGEPLYVFHHVAADYRIINPPPPPSDSPWSDLDLPWQTAPLSCDPTLPDTAVRGSGERPTQATAIIDFHGARWTVYADERNRELRRINHETGAVWSFNYDPIGQLIGMEDPRGARTCVVRDERGNVTRRVDVAADVAGLPTPSPIVQSFAYAPANAALTAVSDPRTGGWMTTITRDAGGNPLSVEEAGFTTATFALVGEDGPDRFQIGSITRPGNAVTALTYDQDAGTLASITIDPSGANLEDGFQSDEAGRLRMRTSALGWTQTWSYDNDGPLLARTDWSGDDIAGGQSFEHDADGRVTASLVGPPGGERLRSDLAYDVTGALVRSTQIALDGSATTAVACQDVAPGDRVRETVSAEGVRTRYTRDGEGRVTQIVAGDLGPSPRAWDDACLDHPTGGTGQFVLGTAEYDRAGGLVAWTDERGRLTTITRDGFGRPVTITRPDGTQLRRGYDALGNVTWEAVYATSGAPPYRPPSWTDGSLHAATQMVYDERARLREVHRWHFDGAQVPVGDGLATIRIDYDDAAHTVTRTDDAGHPWVTRYDAAGRLVEDRAPDGTTRSVSYPGTDHRTVRISEPGAAGTITRDVTLTAWGAVASDGARVGTTTYPLATTRFDDLLRPVVTTSLTGAITAAAYDAFGRTTREQHTVPGSAGETIEVGYDRDGRLVSRTSTADGATTGTWSWRYDGLGREVDAQDPGGRRTTTTYVAGSQLPDIITDPRGVQFQHTWSPGVGALYLNAIDPAGPDTYLTYVWSWRGDLTAASRTDEGQPQVANTFTHDSLGDRTRETDNQLPAAWMRTTTFDGRGLPIKTTTNTTSWTRAYDALGRLDNLKVGTESTALAKYTYAGFGVPLTRFLQNGVETRTTYDVLGRLASQTDVQGTATLAAWTYQVPLDGVPRRADFRRGTVGGEKSVFTVDAALRLVDEDNAANPSFALAPTTSWASANTSAATALGAQASRYTLDGRSAWTRRTTGASVVDYLRDARDALTRIGTQDVSLDLRGAITNDGQIAVVYDALGQVQRVTKGTDVRTYRRDALGRVVSETDQASAVTRYAWDGSSRIVRQRPDGSTFDITIDGAALDEHVATLTGTARQFLHQDRRGSVYMVTDHTGAPREWTSYTAYGEATLWNPLGAKITSSAVDAQFGFNGLPHDLTLGLVDMRARMYDPQLGRFLSPDPLGLVDGTNRFAFAGAAPLSFRDPFGLCIKHSDECAAWSAYAGFRGYDSIPSGTNFHSLMHGVTDLGVADDLLRGINNLNDRDPCNTGRGRCSYDTWATRFRGVGKIATGAAGFVFGKALCVSGIGCAIGGPIALASADYAGSAATELWTGAPAETFGGQTLGPEFQEFQELAVSTAAMLGGFVTASGVIPRASPMPSVWQRDPTQRGVAIERDLAATEYKDWYHIGAERNGTFPLIDFQNGNTVVSLKSVDTVDTAGATWVGRMEKHIVDLATRRPLINGVPADIVLDLRVPPGGTASADSLVAFGERFRVSVQVSEYP